MTKRRPLSSKIILYKENSPAEQHFVPRAVFSYVRRAAHRAVSLPEIRQDRPGSYLLTGYLTDGKGGEKE